MMNNFIFENKTKVYFGKGGVKEYLGGLLANFGETVMLAYGGGSIKRNGVYDEIMGNRIYYHHHHRHSQCSC